MSDNPENAYGMGLRPSNTSADILASENAALRQRVEELEGLWRASSVTDEQMVEAVARAIAESDHESFEGWDWLYLDRSKAAIAAIQPYFAKARKNALEEAIHEINMAALVNSEDASSDWIDGMEFATKRLNALKDKQP